MVSHDLEFPRKLDQAYCKDLHLHINTDTVRTTTLMLELPGSHIVLILLRSSLKRSQAGGL